MTYRFEYLGILIIGTPGEIRKAVYPKKSLLWVKDNLAYIENNPEKNLPFTTHGMSMAETYRQNAGRVISKQASRRSPFGKAIY
jgi:hypothetical protein